MSGVAKAGRIAMGTAVAALFSGLAWADAVGLANAAPAWWLLPIAVVVAIGGVDEMCRLCAGRGLFLPAWPLRPAVVAVPLAAACGAQAFSSATSIASPTAAIGWATATFAAALVVLCAVEVAGYRPASRAFERLSVAAFVMAYLGLPLAFMVSLRLLCVENLGPEQRGPGHLGIVPLLSLVGVVKAGDVAAYAVGSLAGRNRMAPLLSPGKTWEGAGAGLAGSLAASWFILRGAGLEPGAQPWGGWMAYGLAVGAAGMLGDLAESLIKRELDAKDSGRSLGGLGGVLDLVDSLLLATPVAWLMWVNAG
ncbi:MAG: hypothetical protein EBR28_09695 [Planctomycetia bacterium]|nr:hypothetical protein [Planctomycetia bacterium]